MSAIVTVLIAGSIMMVRTPNRYEDLKALADRLDGQPATPQLKELMNYPADGAYAYYQMALIGVAFSHHPYLFREVASAPGTARVRRGIEKLATLGEGVFEYYPELKPPGFAERFEAERWQLQRQRAGGVP